LGAPLGSSEKEGRSFCAKRAALMKATGGVNAGGRLSKESIAAFFL